MVTRRQALEAGLKAAFLAVSRAARPCFVEWRLRDAQQLEALGGRRQWQSRLACDVDELPHLQLLKQARMMVQAAPSGIAVRCGDYFTYPATTPGALTLHDQARRSQLDHSWPACVPNSAEQWSTQTAGYEAFSSIAYEADLWNIKTVFPDLEAQVEADKLTIPPAIYGANQFIQQAVQAKVPAYILTPPAAVTTGLHH